MENEILETNTITLANGIELGYKVIQSIAGEEISNALNGEVLSSTQIKDIIAAKLQSQITRFRN